MLVDFLYLGRKDVSISLLDKCWLACCTTELWELADFKMMSRLIATNGLAVALWIGAEYIV